MSLGNKYTSADLMRKKNARSVLRVVHQEAGIFRKMLAERTNLAAQTVTNIITILIDHGIVLEQPLNISGKGRNPYALQINYAGFYIISVKITNFCIDVYLNSLDAKALYEQHYKMEETTDALAVLKNALNEVFIQYQDDITISAIIISEAGIVDERNGIVIEDYGLRWHYLNLREALAEYETPVLVLNDVNIIAHYENSIKEDNSNFMVVEIDNGVGSAMVLDGHVLYSSNRVAGEFGHVTASNTGESVQCFCGRKNCITRFISKSGLKRRFDKSYPELQADVRNGAPGARDKIEDIGKIIAPKLSDLIVLLDLERIILYGSVIEDFENIIYPCIQEEIKKNMSFWIPFRKLEVKKYDCFPRITSHYIVDFYFSADNDLCFLWDVYL